MVNLTGCGSYGMATSTHLTSDGSERLSMWAEECGELNGAGRDLHMVPVVRRMQANKPLAPAPRPATVQPAVASAAPVRRQPLARMPMMTELSSQLKPDLEWKSLQRILILTN